MTAEVFWTLPSLGDGLSAASSRSVRGDIALGFRPRGTRAGFTDLRDRHFNYYDYLFQVVRAVEVAGFQGAFVPWSATGEDPWIVACALARRTRRITLIPEIQAAFATPVYLAKMSVSFQRLSGNRLGWKLDVEREHAVRRAHADALEGADWFARADEYLEAAKGVWTTRPYSFRGRFYDVEAGGFDRPLAGLPLPPIFTSGASEEALALAAKHADVHVLAASDRASVGRELDRLRRHTEASGRQVQAGIRLRVVARHTDEEAARDAGVQSAEGALIGSYRRVVDELDHYARLGVTRLILDATPRLEEAYRLGEHVFPKLGFRFAAQESALASA